jgi:hypothetical protein
MASNAVRIYLADDKIGPLFKRGIERQGDRVRSAIRGAASDAAVEIEARGDADILAGGNFGDRWTDSFQATVTQGGGNIRIDAGFTGEDTWYWRDFEEGITIYGKPLLFIPLPGVPTGLFARDYPGALFRTTRKSDGLVLLGDVATGEMKYFGKPQITINRKWHLKEIIRQVANELKNYFKDRMS